MENRLTHYCFFGVLVAPLVIAFLQRIRGSSGTARGGNALLVRKPLSSRIVTLYLLLVPPFELYLWVHAGGQDAFAWLTVVAFSVLVCGWLAVYAWWSRFCIETDLISVKGPWGRGRRIPWSEVKAITYDRLLQYLIFTTEKRGSVFWLGPVSDNTLAELKKHCRDDAKVEIVPPVLLPERFDSFSAHDSGLMMLGINIAAIAHAAIVRGITGSYYYVLFVPAVSFALLYICFPVRTEALLGHPMRLKPLGVVAVLLVAGMH